MNSRELSGSAEYSDQGDQRQRAELKCEENNSDIQSDLTNTTSCASHSVEQESAIAAEDQEGMTREHASQPPRNLPSINHVLGPNVAHQVSSSEAEYNLDGPHPYPPRLWSSWNPGPAQNGSRPPIFDELGKQAHPPMMVPNPYYYGVPKNSYEHIQSNGSVSSFDFGPPRSQRAAPDETPRTGKSALGHTKSGKPRMRQPEACETCRHKKIKCELPTDNEGPRRNDTPIKCVYCEKTGTVCAWRNQPMDITSPASAAQGAGFVPVKPQGSPQSLSPKLSPPSSNRRSAFEVNGFTSYDDINRPVEKKPRLTTNRSPDMVEFQRYIKRENSYQSVRVKTEFHADADPFEIDRDTALKLLNNYFDYHDHSTDKILPRESFTNWCLSDTQKNRIDIMLIHATLALGSIFATTKVDKDQGKHLAKLADATLNVKQEQRRSLKVVLTRHHLAAFFWADGRPNEAFEYNAWALVMTGTLRYNDEEGCSNGVSSAAEENDFGFSRTELIECRRRVFWHGYIFSRIKPFTANSSHGTSDQDVLIRVPMNENEYERGMESLGTFFKGGRFDLTDAGLTATKVSIISIWGEMVGYHRRSSRTRDADYAAEHKDVYQKLTQRFRDWFGALQEDFRYSPTNTHESIRRGYFVEYFVLNACYHIAMMKLHRHGRVDILAKDVVLRHIKVARQYARQFLELISVIAKSDELRGSSNRETLETAACQPFALEAIMYACDIFSSRGHVKAVQEVQSFLGNAKTILTESERVFSRAERQKCCVETRLSELGAHVAMRDPRRPHWNFERNIEEKHPPREKLEQSFLPTPSSHLPAHSRHMDLVYEAKEEVYFEAIGDF